MGIRLRLIEQWRSFWRMWSLRFTALGTALLGWITVSPDVITSAWNSLPDEIKAYIPQEYLMYVTLTLFVLGMVSRLIKQEKLPTPDDK